MFSSIVDRIKQKARGWSTKLLSSAGKLTMIQSVLSAVPSYAMSYFALPVSLCDRIQSAVTRFWWDSNESTKKMAWVAWSTMAKPKSVGGLGVRDFQTFNVALLAKTSWRLLQKPDCLLGRVLMGKYCTDSNILLAAEVSNMSHRWRSVLLGRDLLVKNLGWLVGNGQSIQVWSDSWLSTTSKERPMGPPNEHLVNLRVSDLMVPETCEWDEIAIQRYVPDFAEKIKRIKPSQTGAPDKLIWLGTKTGDYSTKSGYFSEISFGDNGTPGLNGVEFNWKKNVWALSCAPKVKTFAWKLLKGALPVGERLTDRHVPVDASCKRCGASESITHLFFQCPFSKQVWSLAPFTSELELSGMIDLVGLWPTIVSKQCLPPTGVTSKTLGIWILWNLWKARNKFVFEGVSCSPEEALSLSIKFAREWEGSQESREPPPRIRSIAQPQTAMDTIVVRSDGAWSPLGSAAGLGWIIHAPAGPLSYHQSAPCVESALMAEGLALLEAVKAGVRERLKKVVFETDSATLIKALNSGSCIPELYGVIQDIISFVSVFDSATFSLIPRERNSQADVLAKSALSVVNNGVVDEAFMASS